MENAEKREYRQQTNAAVLTAVVTKTATLKLLVDTQTGEVKATNAAGGPLEVANLTVRVDNGDEAMFIDVEAVGPMALAVQQLQRRQTVCLTGSYEIQSRKVGEGDAAVYYQNDKFRIIDRRVKFDGSENPDAPAPISLVDAKTPHTLTVLYYGTVGKKGMRYQPTQGGRPRTRFSAANNRGSEAKPRTSWFDNVAYGDVARGLLNIGSGSLVKITGKVSKYKGRDNRTKIEITVRSFEGIAIKAPGIPTAVIGKNPEQQAEDTLHALDQMDNHGGQPLDEAIDTDDTGSGAEEFENIQAVA